VGTILGILFAGGSIISIANMTVPWSNILLVTALLVPATFMVSGIGAWLFVGWGFPQIAIGLIAFPWLYIVVFSALMLVSFK
jgi:hypothetical protein